MGIHYKSKILILLLITGYQLFSQEILTKKIEKSFEMTNAGELHIENKYGNVNITGWNENNISITIDIKVSSKKKENTKALIERIIPKFNTTDEFISIVSEINKKNTNFFSKYFNKVNPFEFDKSNIEINYTIYLPINAEIDIVNKFGDIIIDNWTGKLKANIEHGDLWINESIANANIDMKFGKLRTKSITYGNISLKNGDIDIENSQDLTLKTSGAIIEINKVIALELLSSKDEITIENVEDIHGSIKFSNVQIDTVDRNIDLMMKIADLKVSKISKANALVTIDQESSDININISDLSFKFNATLEEGLLRLPISFSNIKTKVIDKSKRIREISASYGKSLTGAFTFNGNKGAILLKE